MLSALFGLFLLPVTLAVPSMPFCVLQLALCKYCKGDLLPKLPLILSGLGLAVSFYYISNTGSIEVLTGMVILVPSLLCLIGSGLGWLIWKYAQEHLY